MKYLLGKFSDNWADEMDVSGLFICTPEAWDRISKKAQEHFTSGATLTYYLGTNEEIEYEDYTSWIQCFSFKELDGPQTSAFLNIVEPLTGRRVGGSLLWKFGFCEGAIGFFDEESEDY